MMHWISGVLALLVIVLTGSGAVRCAWRGERALSVPEWLAWSWLVGTVLVTVYLALGGIMLPAACLVGGGVLMALFSGFLAWRGGASHIAWFPVNGAVWEKWLVLPLLGGICWMFVAILGNSLTADGLLIWEFKAHIAFLNGGHLPASLFSDPSRVSLHPGYPLCIPMVELWVYLCAGQNDQTLVKVIFPMFHLTAVFLLWGSVARITGRLWAGALVGLAPIFIPELSSQGTLIEGYADYPLGVYYLATVCAVMPGIGERQWFLAAISAAALPWVKQEGILLWLSAVVVALVAAGPARWRTILWTVFPGGLVAAGWKLAMQHLHVAPESVFSSINLSTIPQAVLRIIPVADYFGHELADVNSWSLLWIIGALACIRLCRHGQRGIALIVATFLPLLFDFVPYLFTKLDLGWHLETSCARLVLQGSLVALLAIGAVLAPRSLKRAVPPEESAQPVGET